MSKQVVRLEISIIITKCKCKLTSRLLREEWGDMTALAGVGHNFFAVNVKFGSVTVSEITLSFSIKKLMTTEGAPL